MINLNKEGRKQGLYSYSQYLSSLLDPDIYLANSVNDFVNSAPQTDIPRYKELMQTFSLNVYGPRFYVILNNVKIESIEQKKSFYLVSDKTGEFVAHWSKDDWLPATMSFEESGIKSGESVYEVMLMYLIEKDFSSIMDVNVKKTPKRRVKTLKKILDEFELMRPEPGMVPV